MKKVLVSGLTVAMLTSGNPFVAQANTDADVGQGQADVSLQAVDDTIGASDIVVDSLEITQKEGMNNQNVLTAELILPDETKSGDSITWNAKINGEFLHSGEQGSMNGAIVGGQTGDIKIGDVVVGQYKGNKITFSDAIEDFQNKKITISAEYTPSMLHFDEGSGEPSTHYDIPVDFYLGDEVKESTTQPMLTVTGSIPPFTKVPKMSQYAWTANYNEGDEFVRMPYRFQMANALKNAGDVTTVEVELPEGFQFDGTQDDLRLAHSSLSYFEIDGHEGKYISGDINKNIGTFSNYKQEGNKLTFDVTLNEDLKEDGERLMIRNVDILGDPTKVDLLNKTIVGDGVKVTGIQDGEVIGSHEGKNFTYSGIAIDTVGDDKVTIEEDVKEEEIPFETIYKENKDLEPGSTKVVQEGENGKIVTKYEVSIQDGEEIDRKEISKDETPKKDKIVEYAPDIVKESEPIPFETIYKENPDLEPGTTEVVQEGKEGKDTTVFEVVKDIPGVEDSKTEVGTEKEDPQDKIIEVAPSVLVKKAVNGDGEALEEGQIEQGQPYHYTIDAHITTNPTVENIQIQDDLPNVLTLDKVTVMDEEGNDITGKGNLEINDDEKKFTWTPNEPADFIGKKLSVKVDTMVKEDADLSYYADENGDVNILNTALLICLLYTSPSPRDRG